MHRTDALVAAMGAAILALAVGGAVLGSVDEGAVFLVRFEATEEVVELEGPVPLDVPLEGNVSEVRAEVTFSMQPMPPTASARLVLTAPNGTAFETEGAPAPGATSLSLVVVAPVAPVPEDHEARAASAEDARARLGEPPAPQVWRVEWDFSSGSALPAQPAAQASARLVVRTWAASVEPAAPGLR